jgi:hypothetical protein
MMVRFYERWLRAWPCNHQLVWDTTHIWDYHGLTSEKGVDNIHYVEIFLYVKDEGIDLSTIMIALTFVVLCKVLGCNTIIMNCWGHTMSKYYQYVTNDTKICVKVQICSNEPMGWLYNKTKSHFFFFSLFHMNLFWMKSSSTCY